MVNAQRKQNELRGIVTNLVLQKITSDVVRSLRQSRDCSAVDIASTVTREIENSAAKLY